MMQTMKLADYEHFISSMLCEIAASAFFVSGQTMVQHNLKAGDWLGWLRTLHSLSYGNPDPLLYPAI
jgi:hypothetical protein